MSFAPEPAYAHGTAPTHRRRALQPRHARRADAGGGAPLPRRVPERPARRRDPARCSGGRSCTASSCACGRRARRASTRASGRRKARRSRSGPRSRRCCSRGYLGQRGHRVVVRHAMRYGKPSIAERARRASRRPAPTRVLVLPLYPQYAAATTASVGDARRGVDAARPQPARAALRQALPRRSRLHRRPGPARQRALARNGRARQAGAQLPRPAAALADARRPVPLRVPEDRRACSPSGSGCATTSSSSPSRAASARPSGCSPTPSRRWSRWPGRRRPGRRHVPGLHVRLPRDARGDRPGGARRVPRRRRQAVRLHPLPERPARVDRGAGGDRRSPPRRLADRRGRAGDRAERDAELESSRRRALAAGAAR